MGVALLEELREKIITGKYKGGESLTEMKLAQEYGMSRTPIREALRKLEVEGLVNIIPNKGAVVSSLTDEEISNVFNIRMRIESMAAYLAAKNITESQLEQLRDALELFEFYIGKGNTGRCGEEDFKFHDIIYDASGSRPVRNVLQSMNSYIRSVRHETLKSRERMKQAVSEHIDIFNAIKEGNAELAEELAYKHVVNAAHINKACITIPLGGKKL